MNNDDANANQATPFDSSLLTKYIFDLPCPSLLSFTRANHGRHCCCKTDEKETGEKEKNCEKKKNCTKKKCEEEKNCERESKEECRCRYYSVKMVQIKHQMHPRFPEKTVLWSFNGLIEPPLIDVDRYTDIKVDWKNRLPTINPLSASIDHTLMGAEVKVPDVRTVIHLHGGEQASSSDGFPLDWYTPGHSKCFHYPNHQEPTMLFWHDHSLGITRLNNYLGISGGVYIIRDPKIESKLCLPSSEFEIPLVITDKSFTTSGQLFYPTVGENPAVHPQWVSHFLGNTILVNNTIWPVLRVQQNKYRFRIVIGSNTRTFGLKLFNLTTNSPGPLITQIGSDGGYLPTPIVIPDQLILGVAERADIVVDFSNLPIGTEILLQNLAMGTFPGGNPPDPKTTGQVMKFLVINSEKTNCKQFKINQFKTKRFKTSVPKNLFYPLNPAKAIVSRQLLLQVIVKGSTMPTELLLNNSKFDLPTTEIPKLYSTEIWEFINMTSGMHPMHVHLIQFQLLNRQSFDPKYITDWQAQNPEPPGADNLHPLNVTPYLTGVPTFPRGTNEYGWKDVIQCSPGMVTRIIIKFAPQKRNTKFPFNALKGVYLWHCHLLEHEDNEMMLKYQLIK